MDPDTSSSACRAGHTGFTLIELLVVIGLIAVLLSILVPTLGKAKESSRQVKCLSNLKQLSNATIHYVTENKRLPAAPGGNPSYHSPGNPSRGVYDFLCWHRSADPLTGSPWPGQPDLKITDSALAKYLGRDVEMLEAVYRCPSDNLLVRPNMNPHPAERKFRYSYSMNRYVALRKWQSIRNPAQKVLYVCEDELSLDDGFFNPNPSQWVSGRVNAVAARHRIRPTKTRSIFGSGAIASGNEDVLGNVSFCDGHAEIFSRKDALRQRHTDRPGEPDPAGF